MQLQTTHLNKMLCSMHLMLLMQCIYMQRTASDTLLHAAESLVALCTLCILH